MLKSKNCQRSKGSLHHCQSQKAERTSREQRRTSAESWGASCVHPQGGFLQTLTYFCSPETLDKISLPFYDALHSL